MKKMTIYAFRDEEGNYLSMGGGKTKDFIEASKFDDSKKEFRVKTTDPQYKLVTYEVTEVKVEDIG